MTSIIKFTALSGAQNEEPNCYLLQVDEFTFLLDCGWDEWFSDTIIKKIKRYIGQIDAVLLTFPDPQHLGCLPYLIGKMGMNCPVYATVPVYKMGQMYMYDLYQSHHNTEDFDKFTLDDVDLAFDRIIQLKHNQTVTLKDKVHGLSITPFHAAHIIGGTSWKIGKADEEGEIIYAVDFNHKRERHLNGCTLLESLGGAGGNKGLGSSGPPQLFITDAYNALYQQARRKLRDEELLTKIIETMRADGNVLIAVDTAGRVLELAILLDQLWRDTRSGLCAYSLAMINNVTYNVVEFAKSMMEWMSDKIINSFTDQRNSPFQFKHLKLCHNLGDLAQVPHPKCVLASTTDMESGFSRQLFLRWASDPRNSVIITGRTAKGTLARTLIDDPTVATLNLEVRKRVPIVGEELDEYERQKSARKALERNNLPDESSDESDAEEVTKGSAVRHDLMISNEPSKKGGFFKQAKKTFPMYPFVENRIKWDEYGEIINPDDYKTGDFTGNEEETNQAALKEEEEKKMEEIEQEEEEEGPTKCIRETKTIEVKCSVTYIDFEGRSDGESMLKIIQQIKPREVILVRGTPSSTMRFAESLRRTLGGDTSAPGLAPAPKSSPDAVQVFTPAVDEVVDTTKERHIYQVKLRDSLVNTLRFYKAKDAEVCWLDSKLDYTEAVMNSMEVLSTLQIKKSQMEKLGGAWNTDDESEDAEMKMEIDAVNSPKDPAKLLELANVNSINAIPTLVPLQVDEIEGHRTYFVNELRLSDFKQILLKEGIQAEFIGGVLVCNGSVAIRRNQQGQVDMEGCLSEDYYRIRELLYDQIMGTPTHVGLNVPPGHIMVHDRWKGSDLLKILQSKVSVMFFDNSEFVSVVDFKPSTQAAIIYLKESDVISTVESRRRVAKFRRTKGVAHHRVVIEKTKMTQQYFPDFQKFVVIECGMSVFPVLNQEEAGALMAQMVQQDGKTPYRNPFRSSVNTTVSTDAAILNTVMHFPRIGDTKAKQLLEKFGSIKAITEATTQELSSVIGLSSAKHLKLFLEE